MKKVYENPTRKLEALQVADLITVSLEKEGNADMDFDFNA